MNRMGTRGASREATVNLSMRKHAFAAVAATVAVSALAAPTSAANVSRSTLEREMLDACIYRQFEVKGVNRATMVEDCRCAVGAAMKGMTGDSFPQTRSGGLTADQDRAIRGGIAACFRAPAAG